MRKQLTVSDRFTSVPFSYAAALAAGISPGLLRSHQLQHPFRGVRSNGLDLKATIDLCRAYSAVMPDVGAFSHQTAARLWGMPLPFGLAPELHVTVPVPHRAPRRRDVIGHQQRLDASERVALAGLSVTSPAATWAQLAETLGIDDLIAVGEHIVTGNPYEKRLPLGTIDELRDAAGRRTRGAGHRARMAALDQIREGALSRPETLTRLLIARCGLPEPVINGDVLGARGEFIAMPDLHWPTFRVALEYQGDHHRSKKEFRADVARLERLVDEGWIVVQVTAAELFDEPRVIVERVARRLRARGWDGRIHLHRVVTFQR